MAAPCVEWMRVSRRHVSTSIAGRLPLGRSVPMKSQLSLLSIDFDKTLAAAMVINCNRYH